jgi:aminocarboxymuconate-semialdehyde decarboxylase
MRIDVHAHYLPKWYFAELSRAGGAEELSIFEILGHLWLGTRGGDTALPTARAEMDDRAALQRRIEDMDRSGIDLQVLNIGTAHPYLSSERASVDLAVRLNDAYRAVVEAGGGRLAAFGVVPLPHVPAAVAEAERVLDELGFLGIALGCSAAGIPLDDARFDPLWETLNERRAVVYLHPGVEIGGVVGCKEYHLAPDFVSPAEIAVAASRLIVRGHLDRFPEVKIVLATLGGSIPFLARRFDRGLLQDAPEIHARLGGVERHFRRFYVDTSVLEEPDALRAASATFGADRILLGTDYARPGVSSREAIEYVSGSAALTEAEKRAILDENARLMFGL